MSQTMNWSTETTNPYNPISCYLSSSLVEDSNLNNFPTPRAGSVTVIGKRIYSQSCISPLNSEESQRFPVTIKTISRIKRHNTQASRLLLRKTAKAKCPEQPAPPISKPITEKPAVFTVKRREPSFPKQKIKKPELKPVEKEAKPPLTERPSVKLTQILKKSLKTQQNLLKKAELKQKKTMEMKCKKTHEICQLNNKIREENFKRFRAEKFSPRAAWGIDERKHSKQRRQHLLNNIEKQRSERRALKNSPSYLKKKCLGLSKLMEIEQELGFKPRSSSNVPIPLSEGIKPKERDPVIKKYIKDKKEKNKEKKTMAIIENIRSETKRISSLKLLDVKNQVNTKKSKKRIKERKKVEFQRRRRRIDTEDKDSSDFVFEPDSALKHELSGFSVDTEQVFKDHIAEAKERAAILIQKHVRRYIVQQKYKKIKRNCRGSKKCLKKPLEIIKKTECTDMVTSTKSNFSQNQLLSLEEMHQKDITDILEATKEHQSDPSVSQSLSKLISDRYQQLTDILQTSITQESPQSALPCLDLLQMDLNGKESALDLSFPSYASEKSSDPDQLLHLPYPDNQLKTSSEINIVEDFKIQNTSSEDSLKLSQINPPPFSLACRSSPIFPLSPQLASSSRVQITADLVQETSDLIISRIIAETLFSNVPVARMQTIEKDCEKYFLELFSQIPQKEIAAALSKPLRKNPLELLAKMQDPAAFYGHEIDHLSCPPVLSPSSLNSLTSQRCLNLLDPVTKDAQKSHDKLLFDSCNEILQAYRPYGSKGFPLPWSTENRLTNARPEVPKAKDGLRNRLNYLQGFCAGKISDQSFLEEEGIQGVREEKIAQLIMEDIVEKEKIWIGYEFEEMQSLVEISECIVEVLLIEALGILGRVG